jgi:phosphate-selective porin
MIISHSKTIGVLGLALVCAASSVAKENRALLEVLIRKGILTHQEADAISAELVTESQAPKVAVLPGGQSTQRLSLGMRVQMQYAHLDTDIDGVAFETAATNRAFLRRMYLMLRAELSEKWGATVTYDLASSSYDDAFVNWEASPDLRFSFGLRKVNVAYEERASSGNIRALERSSVTRYFVESNNGRRLGAASYRVGAFVDGKAELSSTLGLVYSAAVTTPERNEAFTLASSPGNGATNRPALWGSAGITGRLANNGTWVAGVGTGFLPDQGGAGVANLGSGFDLNVYSVYFDVNADRFGLMAEFLTADVEGGVSATRDATPWGFFVQPSLRISDTFEVVVRYAWLDSDGRGVTLSDAVRSAPSGGTMNKSAEWYAGANWYLRGNDLKYQLGLVSAQTTETVTGGPAEASTVGVRSQLQVTF